MRPGGGKQKGSQFERDVCRRLSLAVSDRDDLFWRSAMSGGRATVAHRKGQLISHVSGDICAVHELGYAFVEEWFVECKFYADLQWAQFLLEDEGKLAQFWLTCKQQARLHGKKPLLIAKQNRMLPYVLMDEPGTLPELPVVLTYACVAGWEEFLLALQRQAGR